MNGGDKSPRDTPNWVPAWAPSAETLAYVSSGLTAGLLVLVGIYLVGHFWRGGSTGQGATIAAGVGVGGAGT